MSNLARGLFGVIAVAGLAVGGYGTFIDGTNTGGITVMLASGAAFAYLAISGQRLKVLRIGGHEAEFAEIASAMTQALEDPTLSSHTKDAITEKLSDIAPALPPTARLTVERAISDQIAAAQYESDVLRAIEEIMPQGDLLHMQIDGPWDFALGSPGERSRLLIETKFRKTAPLVLANIEPLRSFVEQGSSELKGLVVSNAPPSRSVIRWLQQQDGHLGRFEVLQWQGPVDNASLAQAITKLYGPQRQ